MTNEAVIIELFNGGRPIRFTCAEATTILKGTHAELTDPRTIIASTTDNAPLVGITAAEKVGGDGSTTVSVYTDGIFDVKTDAGADAAGVLLANSATENILQTADGDDLLQGSYMGHLLQTSGANTVDALRVNK